MMSIIEMLAWVVVFCNIDQEYFIKVNHCRTGFFLVCSTSFMSTIEVLACLGCSTILIRKAFK